MAGASAVTSVIARSDRRGVAELRLDRPERRNAVTRGLLRTLLDNVSAAVRDGSGAIVLAGSPPAFCAGADLDEFAPDAADELRVERLQLVGETITRLSTLEVPTIAAVDGAAYGAGWGLALACDVCIATARSRFCLPELAKGFRLPEPLMRRLIAVVGPTRAAHLVYTGETLTAEQALACGAVTRVVADRAELEREVDALAASLASGPAQSIATAKKPLIASNSNQE